MTAAKFVLSPQAARDIAEIWQYVADSSSDATADRVESVIYEKIELIANRPGLGHVRKDLTTENVKFFPVYAYLVVYRPESKPVQVVAVIHGRRDVERLLPERM